MEILEFSQIPSVLQEELILAKESAMRQLPKTSDNHVGAVLVSNSVRYLGAGIKRRRFNPGTCAERMVIDRALYEGVQIIDRIVLVGINDTNPYTQVVSPCGTCRQVIYETMQTLNQPDLELILGNQDLTKIVRVSIKELLPLVYENANHA